MPVHDGRRFLERSLPVLLEAVGRDLLELLVVDDASQDGSAELAESLGARVIRRPSRGGPCAARNQGAQEARGELLLFVDADVIAHPEAPARLRHALAEPSVVAAFGSYDDQPPERNFSSQYANLRHHRVHQGAGGEASSFWAGLGAVRREPFLAAGGFDAERFARPSVEDIELGYRLREAGGRIRLLPDAQGTHLKRWTLSELVRTDVLRRAVPWTRLLLHHPLAVPALNVTPVERLKAVVAGLLLLATGLWAGGLAPVGYALALLALAAVLNWPLVRLVARRNGPLFGLGTLLFHQLYYLYGAGAYLGCRIESLLGLAPRP